MKHLRLLNRKSYIIALFIILCSFIVSYGQVTKVEFIKTKVSSEDYMAIEKEWQTIHQHRLDQGQIYGWYLVKKYFTGTKDPYDYIILTVYPSLRDLQTPLSDQIIKGYDDAFFEKTKASRDVIRSEIYDSPVVTDKFNIPHFMHVTFVKVDEDMEEEYINFQKDIWKPAFEYRIKKGIQSTYSLYRLLYPGGYTNTYNYMTVSGFTDFPKVTQESPQKWQDLLISVHQNKDPARILSITSTLRQQVKLELWEVVATVQPGEK